ncbi:MAG: HAD family hydrolase [Methanophagales archaeon]|nr:HAD family hydrolase [Methanophagales archaeon]
MKNEKKRKIEAVLFDLDGVIINSFESWFQAFNRMLKAYRREEVSRAEFRVRCWGPDLDHILENFLGKSNQKDSFSLVNFKRKVLDEQLNLINLVELSPGAREVLSRLRGECKLKVGLVTNTPKKNVQGIFEQFGLFEYFDAVVTGDEVARGKPDAEMVLEACKRLGVKPENSVLVGDTESDFQAGKSAGCAVVVGVGVESSCDLHIKNLNELFAYL